jgi:hypothetical protein
MAARLVSSTKNQQVLHVTPEFNGAKIAILNKTTKKNCRKITNRRNFPAIKYRLQ